jgi:hypothetical protein
MTQATFVPGRWAVVEQFQQRRGNHASNSFEFEIADHAISYVIDPDRTFDDYFVRNAWRDAKSVVLRQRRRQQTRFVALYGRSEDGAELDLSIDVQVHLTNGSGALQDAEMALVWSDAYSRLRAVLHQRNPFAAACLDAWRDGEEEQETAAALGISRDYVKKLRRLIRDLAAEMFSGAEWTQ